MDMERDLVGQGATENVRAVSDLYMVLFLMLNLLLAACSPANASNDCDSLDTTHGLSLDQQYSIARQVMDTRLGSILSGEIKLLDVKPNSPERAVKETLEKASVLIKLTYQHGDFLYDRFGAGVIVDKSATGMTILTNMHVVDDENNKVPDGAILIDLRIARTVNDLLIDISTDAVVVLGNYVRMIPGQGDVVAVRVINQDGQFDKQLQAFEAMSVDSAATIAADQKYWFMPRPNSYKNQRLDPSLGVGVIFDEVILDGCTQFRDNDVYVRTFNPAESGMSGTVLANVDRKAVGLVTQLSIVGQPGAYGSRSLILDFGSEVDEIISAARALTLTTNTVKMALPLK